jgi:hypothetical protein
MAFRIIYAQDPPDHSTIARFRLANAARFADLFTQVLLLLLGRGWAGSARQGRHRWDQGRGQRVRGGQRRSDSRPMPTRNGLPQGAAH